MATVGRIIPAPLVTVITIASLSDNPFVNALNVTLYVPAVASPGVQLNTPVFASKVAPTGIPTALNVAVSPSGSVAVNVNVKFAVSPTDLFLLHLILVLYLHLLL